MTFNIKWSALPRDKSPVFVSFFGGAEYYFRAAEHLTKKLEHFGMGFHVCEMISTENLTWADICKAKIAFVRDVLDDLKRPIFWLDADTDIITNPSPLLAARGADISCFLRGFGYLPEFDFGKYARLLHPGYVLYANSPQIIELLSHMQEIAASTEQPVTDDYLLHEALFQSRTKLSLHLFSPDLVASSADEVTPSTIIIHGDSGNVKNFKKQVLQHQPRQAQKSVAGKVLAAAATDLAKIGKRRDSLLLLKQARKRLPDDDGLYLRELNARARAGHILKVDKLLDKGKKNPELQLVAFAWDYERKAMFGLHGAADKLFEQSSVSNNPTITAALRSKQFRFSLNARTRKMMFNPTNWVKLARRVRLWWWQRPYPGNWGDILNPYLIEKLTGVPPKFTERGPRLLAIGSVGSRADAQTEVWGSGFARGNDAVNAQANYHAVRGPLSRALVLNSGGSCPEVYGDPALLLPYVYTPAPLSQQTPAKPHRLGLILHHNHSATDLQIAKDVRVIAIQRLGYHEVEAFLDELTSCEAIISTSLHGIIAAHAYGIPTCWASLAGPNSKSVPGDNMKFRDYALSVGLPEPEGPRLLETGTVITVADAEACRDLPSFETLEQLRTGLLSAAPFPVLPQFRTGQLRSQ